MLFNIQKPVTTLLPMTSQRRLDKQWFISFINYHKIIVLLKQSPAAYWVRSLQLVEVWPYSEEEEGFIFQQDGAPSHTARSAQNWLKANCPDFITKDQWPPNSPNVNPMDYHVCGATLEAYRKLKTKPKTIAELDEALQVIWNHLPQRPIDKTVKDFSN